MLNRDPQLTNVMIYQVIFIVWQTLLNLIVMLHTFIIVSKPLKILFTIFKSINATISISRVI